MFRRNIFILMLAFLMVFLSACGGKKATDTQVSTSAAGSTQTPAPQEQTAPDGDSTSGSSFVMPDGSFRPYAVMIDNEGPRPLPQGGLYKAQVIYEVIVEGGITRLMALFWNTDPELIGPVRSARHYFLDYAMENDAIYVHFGGSPQAYSDLKKLKINDMDGVTGRDGGIFWDITKDKNNWQDSYTSMEKVKAQAEKLKYRTASDKKMVFEYNGQDVEPANGQKAEKIEVKYTSDYTCGFEYDQKSRNYLRTRQGKPHMERTNNQQLTAKNIIIESVRNIGIKGDTKGRQTLDTLGKGEGWLISDGKAVKIQWSKESRDTRTVYTDEAGNPIKLNPGLTWVQILPQSGKVTME